MTDKDAEGAFSYEYVVSGTTVSCMKGHNLLFTVNFIHDRLMAVNYRRFLQVDIMPKHFLQESPETRLMLLAFITKRGFYRKVIGSPQILDET